MTKDDSQDPVNHGSDLPPPTIAGGCLPLLTLVALGWVVWQWVTWPDVKDLADNNPETTAFIELYRDGGTPSENRTVDWRWVPYREISSHLKRAVIVAEDARFFTHHGFETEAIKAAITEAVERGERHAVHPRSPQQLAKNLWLSPTRNPLRKLSEAALTIHLEETVPKRRLLEDIPQRGRVRGRNLRSGGGRTALFQQTGFRIERTRGGPASGILTEAQELAPGSRRRPVLE